jgi:F-type H+-transporting ATPase subunit epsilon
MSHEIDLEKARHELDRAKEAGENDDAAHEAVRRAEARIRAVERAS